MSQNYCGIYYKDDGQCKMFQCRYYEKSKLVRTKSFSIQSANKREAVFEVARIWCLKKAKETGCKYKDENLSTVIQRYQARSYRTLAEDNALIDLYSHLTKYLAVVRHAYKLTSYEYVKELLETGLEEIERCSKDDRDRAQASQLANKAIAQSLLDIERKTGFSMLDQAPNDLVKQLMKEMKTTKKEVEKEQIIHELNGYRWNGLGHMPAEFKRYLRENPEKSIEDLRV